MNGLTTKEKAPVKKERLTAARFFNRFGIEMVFLLMMVISTIIHPNFLSMSNLLSVLRQISVSGPIAIGMTFIIINGNIDLSVGGIVALAGMVAAILMSNGSGVLLAVLAALALGVFVGMLNGYFVAQGLAPFIVTMATNTVLRGLALLTTSGQPVWGLPESFTFLGQGYIGPLPVPIWIFVLIFVIAFFILHHTTLGRNVYAVGGNPEASRLAGISILKSKVFVYCLSGLLAAVTAVVLTSRLASGDPSLGQDYQVDAIAATVIGGTSMRGGEGKVAKTMIGILIIGFLGNILNLVNVSSYMQQVIKGIIILAAVLWDNSQRKKKV